MQHDKGSPVLKLDNAPSRAPSLFMTYFQLNISTAAISHCSGRPTLFLTL